MNNELLNKVLGNQLKFNLDDVKEEIKQSDQQLKICLKNKMKFRIPMHLIKMTHLYLSKFQKKLDKKIEKLCSLNYSEEEKAKHKLAYKS